MNAMRSRWSEWCEVVHIFVFVFFVSNWTRTYIGVLLFATSNYQLLGYWGSVVFLKCLVNHILLSNILGCKINWIKFHHTRFIDHVYIVDIELILFLDKSFIADIITSCNIHHRFPCSDKRSSFLYRI